LWRTFCSLFGALRQLLVVLGDFKHRLLSFPILRLVSSSARGQPHSLGNGEAWLVPERSGLRAWRQQLNSICPLRMGLSSLPPLLAQAAKWLSRLQGPPRLSMGLSRISRVCRASLGPSNYRRSGPRPSPCARSKCSSWPFSQYELDLAALTPHFPDDRRSICLTHLAKANSSV
jgi:hypothetical protein